MESYFLPYGKGFLDCRGLAKLNPVFLRSSLSDAVPQQPAETLVASSLERPIGSPRLRELAVGKQNVVILASDHTRPVPSRIIIPLLLKEIRRGNPDANITILVATGCHRGSSMEELEAKFGTEILEKERIVLHDCDQSPMEDLGTLPSGGRLILNRMAVEADLLVAEGFIEPHFFAGVSGGRKSVLPGVADRKTVLANHNGQFIASPHARAGILDGNPMHEDMVYAARKAGLQFICNVIINARKEILYAFSGDFQKAHTEGFHMILQHCQVKAPRADLVVTSNGGYPLDQNIYQAVKGMTAAEAVVKEHGVIIMVAKSEDGHGGDGFYNTFHEEKDLKKLLCVFEKTPPEKTVVDQWQSQIFARVLRWASVIYISDVPDAIVESFQMIPAHTMEQALEKAKQILKKERWDTIVIPDGVSVIASSM